MAPVAPANVTLSMVESLPNPHRTKVIKRLLADFETTNPTSGDVGAVGTCDDAPVTDTGRLRARDLTETDLAAIAGVQADDGGYCLRVEGRPPAPEDATALLHHRPEGYPTEALRTRGLFEDARLVAVAQILRGWPRQGYAWVSLLQTAAAHSGRGHGRALHDDLLAQARVWPEVHGMRLAVVNANASAEPFWRALGYSPTGETRQWSNAAGQVHLVGIWERPLDLAGST